MVSFQCNACGDVCTKPKLDKHYGQCQSSFDCIDCSKHFNTPTEYKGHTTCISEAEKYQGALYKGGNQNGGGRDNQPSFNSRNAGGGGQGNRGRQAFQPRVYSRATGANETPLGTPIRMSPVNEAPPPIPTPKPEAPAAVLDSAVAALKAQEKPSKKRKSPTDEDTQMITEPDAEAPKKKKSKKDKKGAEASAKSLPSSPEKAAPVVSSGPIELEGAKPKDEGKKQKKSKSKSKSKEDGTVGKDADVEMAEPTPDVVPTAESTPKKRKKDVEVVAEVNGVNGVNGDKKKKKDKSSKKPEAEDSMVVDSPAVEKKKSKKSADDSTPSKKDKKSKKSKTDTAAIVVAS